MSLAVFGWGQTLPPLDTWAPYGNGFVVEGVGALTSPSIRCTSPNLTTTSGAVAYLTLNQASAHPVAVTAYSRTNAVSGVADTDYSIYIDTTYTDGSNLWGSTANFATGTHGWVREQAIVWPRKPIASIAVYLLLRNHSGEAWFSDVSFQDLPPGTTFEDQQMTGPAFSGGATSGWFVRDVAAGSGLVPCSQAASLQLSCAETNPGAGLRQVTVASTSGTDRAVTAYFARYAPLTDGLWWPTLRGGLPVAVGQSGTFQAVPVGATGKASKYPFACVTSTLTGTMIGVAPDLGPVVDRLFYDGGTQTLCAGFDFGLQPGRNAVARVMVDACDPAWGLRDAARRYFARFPSAYSKRVKKEGVWIPFTDPSTVTNPRDFGFAFHEGDNSPATDAALGIYSFRYSEPMTWWMDMAAGLPRTYANAVAVANSHLASPDPGLRSFAQAWQNSGTLDAAGLRNVEYQAQPWADGAVWVLNPNPALPIPPGQVTKGSLVYDLAAAAARYGPGTYLSGEYLDSLEGWSWYLDHSPASLQHSSFPPSFGYANRRVCLPQWFSSYEVARLMSQDLRARGKLLMANTTPWLNPHFMPLLDVAGTEVNWQNAGAWSPEADETMLYRRALSFQRPYLLLMNTDFATWTKARTELYFKRCMAYGVFPSFFSANAATNTYFDTPALYNRDRDLFLKYVPLIRRLAAAGWQPVTNARADNPMVWVERFGPPKGTSYWTVFNPTAGPLTFHLEFSGTSSVRRPLKDAVSGALLPTTWVKNTGTATVTVGPEDCRVFTVG